MQSRNGGFGAFDADNTFRYLNEIPFADHGALLDPPTSDVSGRCAVALARAGSRRAIAPHSTQCLTFIRREQEADGAWFGRWGTNYIYGTWSVLAALTLTNRERTHPGVARAAAWLKSRQNPDGGWGEGCESYWDAGTGPALEPQHRLSDRVGAPRSDGQWRWSTPRRCGAASCICCAAS